ncbi:hypothetical protein FDECE_7541 [Fusarium decemcellulare]|nr:hypothetical protein FDECE_7541 [Fusarium decemcellulare]
MEHSETRRIKLVRIAHVYYTHRNISAARSFLTDFGFEIAHQEKNETYYRGTGAEPFVYWASEGTEDSFGGAAFVVESMDDLNYAAQSLPNATEVHEMKDVPGGGFRVTFKDPIDGFPFHLVYGQTPIDGLEKDLSERDFNLEISFNGSKKVHTPLISHEPSLIKIGPASVHKLGHFGMCVTDFDKAYEFYTSRFNFTASDLIYNDDGKNITTFLHLDRDKELVDHHCFFFFEGPLLGHDWLREKGYENCWGVGRHIMGSQIFDYWFDPSRFILEHYVDGDLVNEEHATNRSKASPNNLHVWGNGTLRLEAISC